MLNQLVVQKRTAAPWLNAQSTTTMFVRLKKAIFQLESASFKSKSSVEYKTKADMSKSSKELGFRTLKPILRPNKL